MDTTVRAKAGLLAPSLPIPEGLKALPNKLVVGVHVSEEPETFLTTIYDTERRGYTDVGTVLSSGDPEFSAGDVVMMEPGTGKFITNFRAGEWIYACARFFGDEGKCGFPALYRPGKYVTAVVDMMALRIRPKNGRILVKRDGYAQSYGALVLPDTVGNRTGECEVLEVCDSLVDIKAGDRVVCHAGSYERFTIPDELAEGYGAKGVELAFIKASSVYAINP